MFVTEFIRALDFVPIFKKMYSFHTISTYLIKTHFNIIFPLSLGFTNGLLSSRTYIKFLYSFLFSQISVTSPAHFILIDLTIIIFSKVLQIKKLLIVQFCHPHLSSSLVCQNIFLGTIFSNTFIPTSPVTFRAKFHTPKRQNRG